MRERGKAAPGADLTLRHHLKAVLTRVWTAALSAHGAVSGSRRPARRLSDCMHRVNSCAIDYRANRAAV